MESAQPQQPQPMDQPVQLEPQMNPVPTERPINPTPPQEPASQPEAGGGSKILLLIVAFLLIIGVLGGGSYLIYTFVLSGVDEYQNSLDTPEDQTAFLQSAIDFGGYGDSTNLRFIGTINAPVYGLDGTIKTVSQDVDWQLVGANSLIRLTANDFTMAFSTVDDVFYIADWNGDWYSTPKDKGLDISKDATEELAPDGITSLGDMNLEQDDFVYNDRVDCGNSKCHSFTINQLEGFGEEPKPAILLVNDADGKLYSITNEDTDLLFEYDIEIKAPINPFELDESESFGAFLGMFSLYSAAASGEDVQTLIEAEPGYEDGFKTAFVEEELTPEERDSQRDIDVNTILNAISEYALSNDGNAPPQIQKTGIEICKTGEACIGVIDLRDVTNAGFLETIPIDPSSKSEVGTGYYVSVDDEGAVTVSAPLAELDEEISVSK